MKLLQIDSLCLSYGHRTLFHELCHDFDAGIYAMYGRNGVGKSTLLAALSGSHRPSSGRILINGLDLYRDTVKARRQLFFVPDQANFYPFITGRNFLLFVFRAFNKDADILNRGYMDIGNGLGLLPYFDIPFGQMSFGTRVKFFLLAALKIRPVVLLMDEPFNGLDPISSDLFVQSLNVLKGTSVILLSTHDSTAIEHLQAQRLGLQSDLHQGVTEFILETESSKGFRQREVDEI